MSSSGSPAAMMFMRDARSVASYILGVLAQAALEVGHLAEHVLDRQSGKRGRFGMAQSRHQMAGAAGLRLNAFRDHGGQRSVLFGKPIRRVELIVDLRLGVGFRAAGDLFRRAWFARRSRVGYGEGPDESFAGLLAERGHSNQNQGRQIFIITSYLPSTENASSTFPGRAVPE